MLARSHLFDRDQPQREETAEEGMYRKPQQILAHEEHGGYLYLLMRPAPRHNRELDPPSWWRKKLLGDEVIELGGCAEKWEAQNTTPKIRSDI